MSEKSVFLAYPFRLQEIRQGVKEAVRDLATVVCADSELSHLQLLDKIENQVRAAHVCLFDLTSHNVNVATEYGFARGLGLHPYIIYNSDARFTPGESDVFSDLRGIDSVRYASFDELATTLRPYMVALLNRPRHPARDEPSPDLSMILDGKKMPNGSIWLEGTITNISPMSAYKTRCELIGFVAVDHVVSPLERIGTLSPGQTKPIAFRYDHLIMRRQPTWYEGFLVEYADKDGRLFEQRGQLVPRKDGAEYVFTFEGLGPPKPIDAFRTRGAGS